MNAVKQGSEQHFSAMPLAVRKYPAMTGPVRVAIVGRETLFQDALATTLALHPDIRSAGSYSSVEEAIPLLRITEVDVVLLVVNPDQTNRLESALHTLIAAFSGAIMVVASEISGRDAFRFLQNDCVGIFLRSQPMAMLVQRIRAIAGGKNHRAAIMGALQDIEHPFLPKLTPREGDVLRGVFKGLSNKEIAVDLGISENTVKTFLQQLFRKTHTGTRSQLVRMAIEQSLGGLDAGDTHTAHVMSASSIEH